MTGSRLRGGRAYAGLVAAVLAMVLCSCGSSAPTPRRVQPTLSALSSPSASPSTDPDDGPDALQAAVDLAADRAETAGLTAAVAVLDRQTGAYYPAGQTERPFGAASVVKVLIAAYLLLNDEMTEETDEQARAMITDSDDDDASALWLRVGGPALEPWIERHYQIADLGSPNTIPGHWGNTQLTAHGIVRLYAALRRDPVVWPWLSGAMAGYATTATDGTNQLFGIPTPCPHAAIKQGWGTGSSNDPDSSVLNSTGYVGGGRYAVAILTEGDDSGADTDGFNAGQARVVTSMAKAALAGLCPG